MISKFIYILSLIAILSVSCGESESVQQTTDFNFGWKFSLSNDIGVASEKFDDSQWDDVRLPHDWSREMPYDSVNGHGCTGYVLGGIGWYRKDFEVSSFADKVVYLHFDGIYNHSDIFVNGKLMSHHVSGYAPFYVDITNALHRDGATNVVAVKVDRSRYVDSRWYSGSGIYRNVKLIVADKLHIPVWGTFITTPDVSRLAAQVKIEIDVVNAYESSQQFDVETKVYSPSGDVVANVVSADLNASKGRKKVVQSLEILKPTLWDTDNPQLYTATTCVLKDDVVIDQYQTSFGIRDVFFNAEKGFFLNGKQTKIKGLCIHADAGLTGVAVPKGVWRRRLQTLKEGGCNALRIAHHPASDELLDLCDEMGILVQDEFFDEWNYPKDKRQNMYERHDDYISRGYADFFEENAEKDLKNTVLSHRNHPSVFQWSIGNEIEWTYPRNSKSTGFFDNMDWSGNYFWSQPPYSPERIKREYNKQTAQEYNIGETAQQLADWTRDLDTSRPIIANCILPSVSFETGYTDALDIVGFSYRRVMFDYAKNNYPGKTVMATESLPQWHEWKAVEERDFVAGLFLWTGIDYLGEAKNNWPVRGTPSGLLDVAGFTKPSYHMYKTLWTDTSHIFMCTQTLENTSFELSSNGDIVEKKPGDWEHALWYWPSLNEHWNYNANDNVVVEVFSNSSEVELFLDGKSLGVKKLSDFPDRIYKWLVPYQEGNLMAKGEDGESISLKTASAAVGMRLDIDKTELVNDAYDVLHVELTLVDKDGTPVRTNDKEVSFTVSKNATLLGVDNGSLSNPYPYTGNEVKTHNGKALAIIQSNLGSEGEVIVQIKSKELESETIKCRLIKDKTEAFARFKY